MLDLTPKEIKERKAITINPSKTCQPVGAMYAALGVHGCMPHSHGSQGCCSYHRTVLSRHFKEPAIATSSSFSEGACVFGGGSNIKTAVKNIFDMYDPEIIAVHTTCLSETIGDDLKGFIDAIDIPEGKYVLHANTPSYVGSHITGFSNMVTGFIKGLSKTTGVKNGKMCVIPGFVNPGDMREVKRLLKLMGVDFTMLPDTTGVFDAPMTGKYEMYPKGGTKIQDIIELGDCEKTLALGSFASEAGAATLEKSFKIPYSTLKMPIGIGSTDELIMELSKFSKQQVPYELEEERGQLVDIMIDSHPYYDGKKVALYGDPDVLIALSKFLLELGMIPKYVITGTPSNVFEKQMQALFDEFGVEGCIAKQDADLFELHQLIKNESVDLLMGGTHGKYIARAEDIPLVRIGFPVLDRYVHSYMPNVGYRGAMRLLELMLGALMDRQDRDVKDEDFELVM
ncbi:MAG: nitrogenase molybdenum-iron protein subunit beta [Clostridium beijerinckii]|jgi:nitrogenase molybdenum-iron protein beta chain|uniref:Nitrogenase molybdenum-iron protein beta chain n=2 Tax=Clostridium TaxID=1485 RepID=A0A1S8PAZ5_CLOBE|nr:MULTISPECIES: nitrogenase molybdenum-iron protein subunit beta [Clostridium]MBN7575749.1 nitrogenase molybdenum-iron protein subunit beta [Clostridium beijerinckii]MBN7580905.1 nitrogenase molybdenum-iron protein subunit beta [Clostridium beijerinckii]MBN7585525.1 nitrogenase molybdenum-iron protein subunit beta [Clostridium beijerinckii]MBO0521158.1 nitrogenase molybdenum-iron protein subunit beta [Clostridium beijerinckii]MCI1580547.1 nitrogenase molybdenum-iron protein subunit beta [Clos